MEKGESFQATYSIRTIYYLSIKKSYTLRRCLYFFYLEHSEELFIQLMLLYFHPQGIGRR
jgi:hypothetical protein